MFNRIILLLASRLAQERMRGEQTWKRNRVKGTNTFQKRWMMDNVNVYVLASLSIDAKGNVISRNVGVTFDVFEAEAHKAKGVENEFEMFAVLVNWREDAEQSELIASMRDFRDMVKAMQDEALR